MNAWQIKFINENLPQLIKVTSYDETLIALLISKGLLNDEEVQVLRMEGRNYGGIRAASWLYSILKTRTKGFFGLMEALQETGQTGAWNIFRSGIQEKLSTFPVELASDVVPLNELFTAWTNEDSVKCLDSADTMREFCHLLSNDTEILDIDKAYLGTNTNPPYIPRFVSNRVVVKVSAFTQDCEDVFVFKGIDELIDLAALVNPNPVRSSSDQVTLITCRHIYLEDDEDWDDLRDVTKAPLHLINKEEGEYSLQRSTQITDTILSHRSSHDRPTEAYISEEEFARNILENRNTKGICVCDIPGMGKTWFLKSVATKLQSLSKRTLVLFIQLSGFAKTLVELSESPEDPLSYIIEVSCSSKLVSCVLRSHVKRSDIKMIVILDGFDEIRQDYVERTTKFLKQFISADNIQLLISSRPRMRKHLEETFKVISYDILPFTREEQVKAIVGQWKLSIQNNEAQLREHAEKCIRVVKNIQCRESQNILGVPLTCFILADVNFIQAKQIARRKKPINVAEETVISNTCDLYEMFVDSRISKVVEHDSGDTMKKIQAFHTLQALNLLMPTELPGCLNRYLNISKENITEETAVKIGIVSLDSKSRLVFLHRSFAEYFVGKFFAEFWNKSAVFDDQLVKSVAYYFLENMVKSSSETVTCVYGKTLFDSYRLPDYIREEKISWFTYGAVLWFMNSMYKGDTEIVHRLWEASHDNYFTQFTMMLKEKVFNILLTCIEEKFRAILSLFLKIVQVFIEPLELPRIIDKTKDSIPLLLNRIAVRGFPETFYEILKVFSQLSFPLEFNSPLEVSIIRNDEVMFANLLKKVKLPVERLILACLIGRKLSPTDITKRAKIFETILKIYRDKKWTVSPEDLVVYLESFTGLDGLYLAESRWIEFAFHHNLSLYNLPRSNKVVLLDLTLNEVGDAQLFQLLHILFGKDGNLSARRKDNLHDEFPFKAEETLQSLNLMEAQECFAVISDDFSFRFGTIQSLETLKVLLRIHPQLRRRTRSRVDYLFVAARIGAVDWIEYLVTMGHRVDDKDSSGDQPIFHVFDTNVIGVIDELVKHGANICARNRSGINIAHYLIINGNPVLYEFVEYTLTLESGYCQLWTMEDDDGDSALKLLWARLGNSHPTFEAVLSKLKLELAKLELVDELLTKKIRNRLRRSIWLKLINRHLVEPILSP